MRLLLPTLVASVTLALMGCNKSNDANVEASATASETQNSASAEAETSSNLPADAPVYNVATISTFTPFVFRDENGKTIGFDVDILKAVGEKEGFGVNYLVVPWDGIFNTVNTDSHDIISSAIVITPERQQLVDFSQPYIDSGRMAVVKSDLKDSTIEQLADKKFVTQAGTSNVPILEGLVSDPANISGVDTQYLEIQGVLSGKADVAFDDSRVMQYYVANNPDLYGIEYKDYPGDEFGFAVKKGNKELLEKINNGLDEIKKDGTYNVIYKKWFGQEPTNNITSP